MKYDTNHASLLTRSFTLLLLFSTVMTWSRAVAAKTAPPQVRAGTYLQIDGDPLQISGSDMLSTKVFRKQNGVYVKQYYSSMEVYLRLNGTTYSSRNSQFTSVSNTKPNADSIDGVATVTNADGVRVRQQLNYVNGSSTYQHIWTITNTGATTYNDARFLYGGDTYFAGDDSSQGHWDPRLKMIYLTNPDPAIAGIMGLYGAETSAPTHYYEDDYSNVWTALLNATLPDTVDTVYQDAGYALQWDRATLAPGDTWTIVAYEKWTNSGFIQVLAPAAQTGNSGTKVTYQFSVENLRDTADTCTLQATSTSGWPTNLPGGTSVTIPANSVQTVTVELSIPYNAATGATDVLKLAATSGIEPTKSNSDQVVTTAFNPPLVFTNIKGTPERITSSITWTSDELSSSQVEYGTTTQYGSLSAVNGANVTAHQVSLTGLTPGTLYHFRVRSKDNAVDETISGDYTFTTKPPLVFTNIVATPKRLSAVLTWTTDEPSTSLVEYGTTTGYGTSSAINTQLVTNHSVTITGLTVGTGYHFKLHSKDLDGYESFSSDGIFSTKPPLVFTNVVTTPEKITAGITWTTAEASTSLVEYGTTVAYGTSTAINTQMVTSHSVTFAGLIPATTYHFRLHSKDEEGYDSISADGTFITKTAADLQVTAISAPTNVYTESAFDISWTVKNAGPIAATESWTDQVYLSRDTLVGNDIYLGQYPYSAGLAAGASVVRTQTFNLARNLVAEGSYYIIVVTDSGNTVIEKLETNNSLVSTTALVVKNLPRPDLIVDAIDAPASVFSGQKITVQWTVKNQGTGATDVPSWTDQVYLSLDQTISAADNWGTEVPNVSYLRVNESYVGSADFIIPIGYSGTYYIIVVADNRNKVTENDKSNNSKYRAIQIQLTPPPDLQVTSVSAPDTGWSGQPILVNWTVTNKGTGPVPPDQGSWRDGVYLSLDETLDVNTDRYIGAIGHTGVLAVNESYTVKSQSVTIPAGMSGNYYLFVTADSGNQVYEHAAEGNNNNHDTTPIRITLAPPADLVVSAITSPAAGTAGRNITVNWTVMNQGSGDAVANGWYDGIYISKSTTFTAATSTLIGKVLNPTGLPAGSQYVQSQALTLPDQISGPYYIFVVTDVNANVPEYDPALDAEANNTTRSATTLQVTLTPPDLQVTAVSAPTPATAGQALTVTWTVKNAGTGATLVSSWQDYVYCSTSATFNAGTATQIGDFNHAGVLDVNATYTQQQAVILPVTLNGAYYIYVSTDPTNQVLEATNENNNITRTTGTIQVNSTPPDLQVTEVTAPATAKSSQIITVGWTVTNLGTGPSVATSWRDQLYLSANTTLEPGTDILLDTIVHTGALGINATYTGSASVKLPQGISGPYYILVLTNCDGNVFESNTANNLGTNPTAMQVTLASPVDLVVTAANAPTSAYAGQPMTVTWTVTNTGTGTTDGDRWGDAIFLSKDQVFDATDTMIGVFDHVGVLAAAGSYSQNMPVDLPRGISGPYYLFVVTDVRNAIYETNEMNNSRIDITPVQIEIPAPADLIVTAVTCNKTAGFPGQATTFNWTVKNIGVNPAVGTWSDSVYLSADNVWDISDPLLGYMRHDGTVAVNGTYDGVLTAALPGVTPDAYHILVRTDIRDNVNESNESNNIGSSLTTIVMDATELTLGTAQTITLTNGAEFYYKVKVGSDQDLRITLDSLGVTGANELYVRAGMMPDRGHYDAMYSDQFAPDQEVQISGTQAGWYYILVRASNVPGNSVSATLVAKLIDFSVRMAVPGSGSNRGVVTTRILGAKYTKDSVPYLVSGAGAKTAGAKVWCKDRSELWTTFDLRGLATGSYAIEIVDGTKTTTLANAFIVTNGPVGTLEMSVRCTPTVRPGQQGIVAVDYMNIGETDIVAPWLILSSDNGRFQLPTQNGYHNDRIQLLGINNQGPAGVLPPGGRNSITMNFLAKVAGGDVVSKIKLQLAAPDSVNFDWAARAVSFKQEGIPADAWNAIFSNFSTEMGTTLGQANAVFAESASYLSQLDTYIPDIDRLLAYKLNLAAVEGDIRNRYRLGVFGRGFPAIMDVRLRVTASGNVSIATINGNRSFLRQADGSYRGVGEDIGKLTLSDGTYLLREGNGTVFSFSADGRMLAIADTNGNRLSANYTGMRMTGLSDSDGGVETYTYNAQGRITQIADSKNRLTKYTYDAAGEHMLSITFPDGRIISYAYITGQGVQSEHAVSTITKVDGTHTYYAYDAKGRLTRISRDGNVTIASYSYDANGKLTITDALGATATYFTGEFGPVLIWDELGRMMRYSYDDQGHVITATAPQGVRTSYTYDAAGQITEMVNPLRNSVKIAYDPTLYFVQSITDMRGNITRYAYDERGNLSTVTSPNGNFDLRTYNATGKLAEFTNRRSHKTANTYDANNRLAKRTYADGSSDNFTYDSDGNILTATNAQGTTTMVYDAASRLVKITYPSGKFLSYTFDAVGRRTQMVDQSGYTIKYAYDTAGRLQKLSNAANLSLAEYAYNTADQVAKKTLGNGAYTTYEYDSAGQLLHQINYTSAGSLISNFDATYDDLGRKTGTTTSQGSWVYAYDAAGQLTSATFTSTNTAVIANQSISYTYDAAGNRMQSVTNGTTTDYATNVMNQYTAVGADVPTYDADGNLLSAIAGATQWSYTYDDENRILTGTNGSETLSNEYDALGNRIGMVKNGVRYECLVDPVGMNNMVAMYDDSDAVVGKFIYGFGLIGQTNSSAQTSYYTFDSQGNTSELLSSTGAVRNRYAYQPFGEKIRNEGTDFNPFTFSGESGVMDDGHGLFYMRMRNYNAMHGRFMQEDPLGFTAGYNLYSYAENDPIDMNDPTGLNPWDNPFEISDLDKALNAARKIFTPGNYKIPPGAGTAAEDLWLNTVAKMTNMQLKAAGVSPDILRAAKLREFQLLKAAEQQAAKTAARLAAAEQSAARELAKRAPQLTRLGRLSGWLGRGASKIGPVAKPLLKVVGKVAGVAAALYTAYEVGDTIGTAINDYVLTDEQKNLVGEGTYLTFSREGLSNAYDFWFGWISGPSSTASMLQVRPRDPNEKRGPVGYGPAGFVSVQQTLPYTIFFENVATAGAPAHRISVVDKLSANLDARTFRLGEIIFGNHKVTVPENKSFYQTRIPLGAEHGNIMADIAAGVDIQAGEVFWIMTAIDPETGEQPVDPLLGLLPPNDAAHSGEGHVTFTIKAKSTALTGATIVNKADIVFDTNEVIETNIVTNTIDAVAPTSKVNMLPVASNLKMSVSWGGTDDAGGSGIVAYSIYYTDNGGAWTLWMDNSTATSGIFQGVDGHTYQFYSIAQDGAGNTEAAPTVADTSTTVGISVNNPPVATAQSVRTSKGVVKAITLSGTDPDGNALTYTVITQPTHGILAGTAPALTYTPATGYAGADSFTFKVNDGKVDSPIATVTISVNTAPVATAKSVSTSKNVAKAFTLAGTDADGNSLAYIVVTQPAHGILTGNAPTLTYTPTTGYTGADSFTFKVNDGMEDSAPATVSIIVDTPPVATAQSVTTAEDTAKAITLAGTDADGNNLSYTVVTQPAHGILTGTKPNLTYTPALDYNGPDSFTFKVNDGVVDSTPATISITVTAVNDTPVAIAQSVTTAEDTAKAITLAGSDVDGNNLTYIVVTQPAHGTLAGTAPNLTYTPALNYNGPDSFTFKVNDGVVDSATATVSITVTAVNDAPVATAQSVTTAEDTAKAITLAGTDVDGDNLTYTVVTQPAHGILTGTKPNLTYTPALDYNGPDSFTFKVNDGVVDSAIATVSITVTAVNDAPVATAQSVYVNKGIAKTITLTASDADGNVPTYIVVTQPTHGILAGTAPNLTYTPTAGYLGADSLIFKVNDGTVDSAVATVSITVSEPLTMVALTPSLATPQSVIATINLKATATGGAGLLYQFLVNGAVVRDYLATDSYAWKPTIAGTNTLMVKAKDANAVVVTSAAVSYKIMPQVTLVTSLTSPRPINTTITLTANALGMAAPRYIFRISYKDRWGRTIYTVQQAYGVANTLAWKPTVAGTYTITVLARENASTATYDATQSLSYVITPL